MQYQRVALTVALALFAAGSVQPASEAPLTGVRVAFRDTGQAFRVSVTIHSERPLKLFTRDLPWQPRSPLHMVGLQTSSGVALQEFLPIDDSFAVPEPITSLKAYDSATGEIDLAVRFPHLADSLKSGEVVVFWTYRVFPLGATPGGRMAGWLLVGKDGLRETGGNPMSASWEKHDCARILD